MFYIYRKDTKEVKMVSEEIPEVDLDIFDIIEIDDNDYEGKLIHYKNGELVKEDRDTTTKDKVKKQTEKDTLIATINEATTIKDLKDILTNIINKE